MKIPILAELEASFRKIRNRVLGRDKAWTPMPFSMRNTRNDEALETLFAKYPTGTVYINRKNRKRLLNVNAASGVTEQTLFFLQALKNERADGGKLLNVGCGLSDQMNYFQDLGFSAYGIDIAITNDSETIKFHDLNTVDDIPFAKNFFDYVVCQEVVEHVENPWLLFRKIKSVLKTNGILIVTTPNICSLKAKQCFLKSPVGHNQFFNESQIFQHINPIPYWEMIHISQYNGFTLKKVSGNEEFFVDYIPQKKDADKADCVLELSIQNNDILIFVFQKANADVAPYTPKTKD